MPIYGYRCPACGHTIELIQKMSDLDNGVVWCPECDAKARETGGESAFSLSVMKRQITTHGNRAFVPYWDENLTSNTDDSPKWVTSMAHRAKLIKQCGIEESNPRPKRKLRYKNLFFMGGK